MENQKGAAIAYLKVLLWNSSVCTEKNHEENHLRVEGQRANDRIDHILKCRTHWWRSTLFGYYDIDSSLNLVSIKTGF
jgi:hypothetical protein